ncbi:hypothetical protein AMECASPLE_025977 [Ameca splendens]|uniref:Uncharacterized protein n=1 Tax=Ameca splendens TaxID=208324 RepID=A0ABV1A0B3_9TELE
MEEWQEESHFSKMIPYFLIFHIAHSPLQLKNALLMVTKLSFNISQSFFLALKCLCCLFMSLDFFFVKFSHFLYQRHLGLTRCLVLVASSI